MVALVVVVPATARREEMQAAETSCLCSHVGCIKTKHARGVCRDHGPRCSHDGCKKMSMLEDSAKGISAKIKHLPTPPPQVNNKSSSAMTSLRASFSGLLLRCFYWRPPNAWAPPASLFCDMSRFRTYPAPPVPPLFSRPIPSPVRQRRSFFVGCCVFLHRFAFSLQKYKPR